MDERDYIIILYDYYGSLFSEKQREYFEAYYFDNLSLGEISDNEEKSRNAIHKVIKGIVNKLYFYEDKLKMYERDLKVRKIISKTTDDVIKKELEGLL